ncbi:MAG: hypothetical protein HY369_04810 [Candidatus Aenigmarchaeota archaeon]|nr:hypothetical protein [Candidatus Aenigmarchaeota archaeon]
MRGQVWSLDFTASLVIFVTTVVLLLFAFNLLLADAASQQRLTVMQDVGLEVTDGLLRSPGVPDGWTAGTVEVIGFARQVPVTNFSIDVFENILNDTKVIAFVGLDYDTSQQLMGISNYDYFFRMEHLNGTVMTLQGTGLTAGVEPTAAAKNVVDVDRYAVLGGSLVRMVFRLWN